MEIDQITKEKLDDIPNISQVSTIQFNEEEQLREQRNPILIPIPPDGGWGWIVVLGAFFSFFIADGVTYTFGIFLKELSEAFKCSQSKIVLAGAIMNGFFCFSGPFISALINRFGFRRVAVTGSILASISCILTAQSSSLYVTLFTHGIVGGIGFGMIYLPAIIAVGFYFERLRALATAIAICGAGIGGIILPPALTLILDNVGWRHTFRLMAAMSVTCAFFGLLYKPLIPILVYKSEKQESSTKVPEEKKSFFSKFHNLSHPTVLEIRSKSRPIIDIRNDSTIDNICNRSSTSTEAKCNLINENLMDVNLDDSQATSTVTIFKPDKLAQDISSEFIMSEMSYSNSSKSSFRSTKLLKPDISLQGSTYSITKNVDSKLSTVYEETRNNSLCKNFSVCVPITKTCTLSCKRVFETSGNDNKNTIIRPLYRDDIFYSSTLMYLPEYRMYISQSKAATVSKSKSTAEHEYSMSVTRAITQKELNEPKTCLLCTESIKRTLATMLDFSLLKSPSFLLLVLNALFISLGFYTPYMFIKDRSVKHGMPIGVAFWLLSCIGVTNTVGRFLCGIISAFSKVPAIDMSYATLLIGGVATSLSGLSFNMWMQFGYAATYGLSMACISALRTIIIVEMIGLENLTNGIGIILMFQGIAALAGTAISGFLKEMSGDYEVSFYFAGACIVIGSLLLIPIKKVATWEKQRQKQYSSNTKYFPV